MLPGADSVGRAGMNQIDLAGRTAIVTGGAKGIGRAATERFLASGFERDYTSLVAAQETGGRPASSV